MPNYSFYNTKTDEYFNEFFSSWKEAEKYINENKHINWLCGAPPQGDSVRLGIRKPDDGFRDLLKHVKRKNIRSNINTF